MNIPLTEAYNVINELLKKKHKTIFELSEYTKIPVEQLKQKLIKPVGKVITNNANRFTLSQLEKIAEFLNCDLHISFEDLETKEIYHCKSINENTIKSNQALGEYWDKEQNDYYPLKCLGIILVLV